MCGFWWHCQIHEWNKILPNPMEPQTWKTSLQNPPDIPWSPKSCNVHGASKILAGFLRGGCFTGEGVFLGNRKDSVWEDWGTLGKIRGITTPHLKNPFKDRHLANLGASDSAVVSPMDTKLDWQTFSRKTLAKKQQRGGWTNPSEKY